MTSRRPTVEDVPATPHFSFLHGAFRLSRWTIPYFTSTITLEQAARDLHLTTDIPGAEEINWSIDELYQRDLDWVRVETNIVPYLRQQDAPQFFNSLTIALLPYDKSSRQILSDFSDAQNWTPPVLLDEERFAKKMSVGPLRFGFWENWETPRDKGFESGEVRWNTDEVFGVAIDGQHRLAAIKSYAESGLASAGGVTSVPVIFLLFDPRVGFQQPRPAAVVELLRALFIDLNKHAETVSRARQILLDDRDPHAVCVRQVVGTELRPTTDELNQDPPRLPLLLVDWHREQAKFDDGPYLTTVLGLDWMIGQILNSKPVKDFTDYRAVRRQISRVEARLGISLHSATDRLDQVEHISLTPFIYGDDELRSIADAFGAVWVRPLCELLTKFQPYADFLDKRITDGTLSLEFQHWFRLFDRAQKDPYAGRATTEYRQFLGRLSTRPDSPRSQAYFESLRAELEAIKEANLAFNVVFQRALVDAFVEYAKIDEDDLGELEDFLSEEDEFPDFGEQLPRDGAAQTDGTKTRETTGPDEQAGLSEHDLLRERIISRAEEFINASNRIVAHYGDVLEIDSRFEHDLDERRLFWLGTLRKPEGGIDFTQAASKRASDLWFTGAAMCLYRDTYASENDANFPDFWSTCLYGDGPSVCKRIARAINRLYSKESSAAGRILKSREQEYDPDAALEEIYSRLAFLWRALGL